MIFEITINYKYLVILLETKYLLLYKYASVIHFNVLVVSKNYILLDNIVKQLIISSELKKLYNLIQNEKL
jgi:hypothetical protein